MKMRVQMHLVEGWDKTKRRYLREFCKLTSCLGPWHETAKWKRSWEGRGRRMCVKLSQWWTKYKYNYDESQKVGRLKRRELTTK